MSNILARINQQQNIPAVVSTIGARVQVPSVGIQGASGNASENNILEAATNVDARNLETGSLLIYNVPATRWVASRNLVAQDMDGGNF
jgi:hypothetical protein